MNPNRQYVRRPVPKRKLLYARVVRGYKRHAWDYFCISGADCECCYEKISELGPKDELVMY